MAIPEFHFKVPPRKIERVVKPKEDYRTIDRLIDHTLGNVKMSNYEISIYDTNKDKKITIDEIMELIIKVGELSVISVAPSLDDEVKTYRKGQMIGASTPYGETGGGGGSG